MVTISHYHILDFVKSCTCWWVTQLAVLWGPTWVYLYSIQAHISAWIVPWQVHARLWEHHTDLRDSNQSKSTHYHVHAHTHSSQSTPLYTHFNYQPLTHTHTHTYTSTGNSKVHLWATQDLASLRDGGQLPLPGGLCVSSGMLHEGTSPHPETEEGIQWVQLHLIDQSACSIW